MWLRPLFVALLFSTSAVAAVALIGDAPRAGDGARPHLPAIEALRERDWPYTTSFASEGDDIGWFLAHATLDEATPSLTEYFATGTTGPARAYWRMESHSAIRPDATLDAGGGGAGSYYSCPNRDTHLLDCPLEEFPVEGEAGGATGRTQAGTIQYLMRDYGGRMQFGAAVHTEVPVTVTRSAEGESRLVLLAPERGAAPGTYVLETTLELDQPFVAEFSGKRAFHAQHFEIVGPDGSVQAQAACDFGGAPAPRGEAGEWTFRVTGELTEPNKLGYAMIGLMLGEGTRDIVMAYADECGHMSAISSEVPP